jgi:hypothetical protein
MLINGYKWSNFGIALLWILMPKRCAFCNGVQLFSYKHKRAGRIVDNSQPMEDFLVMSLQDHRIPNKTASTLVIYADFIRCPIHCRVDS